MTPRVAYLVSAYPALSHAFIDREVTALRALGWEVDTFSVNPPLPRDLTTPGARQEAERTVVLLADKRRVVLALLAVLLRSPLALLGALGTALRTGPPRPRARLYQLFYLAEATLLLQQLRRRGHRHVHVHFANNGADIARLAVRLGEAVDGPGAGWRWSMSMHGPTEFEDVVGYDLAAKVRSATFTACISEYARARLAELVEAGERSRLAVVRMSVDPERYPPVERTGRRPLRVLFVGRLVSEKAPETLLEAVRLLPDVDLRLQVVGAGPLADGLARTVSAAGLQDRVELCGPRSQDELPELYAQADVFCLPSRAEGLPVVLMEALSTGLPVLTTRITGVPELVRDGQEGLLVEPGRPEELAAALRRLADDPALRLRLGRAGRQRVLEEFTPELNARRLAALLTSAGHAAGATC